MECTCISFAVKCKRACHCCYATQQSTNRMRFTMQTPLHHMARPSSNETNGVAVNGSRLIFDCVADRWNSPNYACYATAAPTPFALRNNGAIAGAEPFSPSSPVHLGLLWRSGISLVSPTANYTREILGLARTHNSRTVRVANQAQPRCARRVIDVHVA